MIMIKISLLTFMITCDDSSTVDLCANSFLVEKHAVKPQQKQEGQLSVSGEIMCTIQVNCLED